MPELRRPRGTRDFLPREMERRRWLEERLRKTASLFGFREVATPTFEHAELFTARSGPGIVESMYVFKDKGGRELALRPELTAPTMRLFVEGLRAEPRPLKLFYHGPCFRYEEPQRGRYREFWQFGAEVIGAKRAEGEVEVLSLAHECLRASGLRGFRLRIGHVGVLRSALERAGVRREAQAPLMHLIDKRDMDGLRAAIERLGADPKPLLALLEASGGKEVLERAPESGLEEVLEGLEACGITDYRIEPGIARGLDYYTGLVFEIDAPELGAEKQVCGGGTYALAELFGAEPVESTGFALGFDRILVALEAQGLELPERGPEFYVISVGPAARREALRLASELRRAGLSADIDLSGRSLAKALRHADAIRAQKAVIIGEEELSKGVLSLRELSTGEQTQTTLQALLEGARRT
ncbi:MAG: histidine--tRNA ligase [Thermoplasmata archaeon]